VDASPQPVDSTAPQTSNVIVIGASTGGPSALLQILQGLPKVLSVPVLVAQHMPPEFVPEFVQSLAHDTGLAIELGGQNATIEDGHIYVAPGDRDMKIVRDPLTTCRILLVPPSAFLKPSIDVLMTSVASVYGTSCLGVILSGMGVDGLEGMRAIKAAGGKTIIQDEATSAVYGMGQAVNNEHLADNILPLSAIASAIQTWSDSHE
jgi:two-component system, chemotaxis family, protein-glutamate methylesterase/glutaminase